MKRNPLRLQSHRAYGAVRDAVVRGDLAPAANCSRCGEPDRECSDGRRYIQAHHHKGYECPLDVEWICPKCHRQETPLPLGEQNGAAKLSGVQVRSAMRLHAKGWTYTEIAERFGVHRETIARAVKGTHWLAAREVKS